MLVLAAGNDARGDDAAGPWVLARVVERGLPGVRTLFDFQFQVEHALDVLDAALVLFIDADLSRASGAGLAEVFPGAGPGAGSHALTPDQVLAVCVQLGQVPPPAFVLSIAASACELGAPMSDITEAACRQALRLIDDLLITPDPAPWRRRCAGRRITGT